MTTTRIHADNATRASLRAGERSSNATFLDGIGDFKVLRREPGRDGHFIINDADRCGSVVDPYIDGL